MKKRNAFTLAEVLITLGIIGIVAAMTLPTLIQKYQDKSDYTHLKKIYSQLLQATLSLEQEYGPVEGWEWTDDQQTNSTLLMERYKEQFKSIKTCEEDLKSCFPNVMYKSSTGENYSTWANATTRASFLLPDGAIMMFQFTNDGCWFQIYVDLNGWKKPNQLGNDFFYFYYFKSINGIRPSGWYDTVALKQSIFKSFCLDKNGYTCTNWFIENGNKDYFKCKDLSYTGKTKCK